MSGYEPDEEAESDARLAAELSYASTHPLDYGDRDGPSDPIGAHAVNWRTLAPEEAAEEWVELREWVEWFTVRYNIAQSTIPNCWWQHGHLVEELSALHTARVAAFDPSDTGYGPISWHERLASALPRLTRAYGGGCGGSHHNLPSRSWADVTDETAWTTWLARMQAQ